MLYKYVYTLQPINLFISLPYYFTKTCTKFHINMMGNIVKHWPFCQKTVRHIVKFIVGRHFYYQEYQQNWSIFFNFPFWKQERTQLFRFDSVMSTIRYVKSIYACIEVAQLIQFFTRWCFYSWHGSSDLVLRDGGCCVFNLGHLSAAFKRPTSFTVKVMCIFVLSCLSLMLFVDVYLKIKPSFHRWSRMVVV